jgi:hypothetical protein
MPQYEVLQTLDPPRPLADVERAILRFILQTPFPQADILAEQVDHTCVVGTLPGTPIIRLAVDRRAPRASAHGGIPTARGADSNGVVTDIQLHVVDGALFELDYYNYDDRPVAPVDPTTLSIGYAGRQRRYDGSS